MGRLSLDLRPGKHANSPARPTAKRRYVSPARPTAKRRYVSPARPTAKRRYVSPARPNSQATPPAAGG